MVSCREDIWASNHKISYDKGLEINLEWNQKLAAKHAIKSGELYYL